MTLKLHAPGIWVTEYINIFELPQDPNRKTKTWVVRGKYGATLGGVVWFNRWRQYAFQPNPKCVFEEDCLRDIAQFVEERTYEHKHPAEFPGVPNADAGSGAVSGGEAG